MERLLASAALVAGLAYAGCASAPKHDPFQSRNLCTLPEETPNESTWHPCASA